MEGETLDLGVFSPSRFLADFKKAAAAIHAPYSETNIRTILEAYNQYFLDCAVYWKTTDRPGDPLYFRFYTTIPNGCNTNAIAVAGGFLKADNRMARMMASWGALYDNASESCDFCAEKGLAKTWLFLGQKRPLDEILHAQDVPESIRRHGPTFHGLGLSIVRYVSVDYQSETVNIYFDAPGPISDGQAAQLVALAGSPPPSQDDVLEMSTLLKPTGFTFAVTIAVATGVMKRVAFYTMKLPVGEFPNIGERLLKFFEHTPSYDDEECNCVNWSFGIGGNRYIKGERSYCGQLVSLLRKGGAPLTVE